MRFLIIEEDSFLSSFLADKLKNEFNCIVDQAQYSQKAFRLLKSERPYDFIIADIYPGLDVYAYYKRHRILGDFVFYSTSTGSLPTELKNCLVFRYAFSNLEEHITKRRALSHT